MVLQDGTGIEVNSAQATSLIYIPETDGTYYLKLNSGKDVRSHTISAEVGNTVLLMAPNFLTDTSLRLNWSLSETENIQQVELYLSNNSGTSFVMDSSSKIAEVKDPTQTNYTVTQLLPDSTYYFKIRVVYKDGRTLASNEVSAVIRGNTDAQMITYQYDAVGNMIATRDPNGNTTTYEYDALNRVVSVVNADSSAVTNTYDAMGRLVSVENSIGATEQYEYDVIGRQIKYIDPDGGVLEWKHDAAGHVRSETDPNGHATNFVYDAMGRTTSVINPQGSATHYKYDANDNLETVTDPNGNNTSYRYDGLNRLTSVIDPMGNTTTMGYDAIGNKTSLIQPNGSTWNYTYNERNQLESVTEPIGVTTAVYYDLYGRMQATADGNNQLTSYDYDVWGNIVVVTDPLNQQTQYVYDANGNVIRMIDRSGRTTNYEYDVMNRLTAVEAQDIMIRFGYDGAGRRIQMTDQTGTTNYTYTAAGRLKEKTLPDAKKISYTYDPAGQLVSTIDYTGTVVSRTYDDIGRLTRVQDGEGSFADYTYDAGGRLTHVTLPNNVITSYAYDPNDRVIQMTTTRQGSDIFNPYTYTYDVAGNITSMSDHRGTSTYAYDGNNRLLRTTSANGTQVDYRYDGAGNRLAESTMLPGQLKQTRLYSYNALNQLIGLADENKNTAYTYDLNGNLLEDGRYLFSYDSLNRLLTVTDSVYDAISITDAVYGQIFYEYNGDGLRIGSIMDGQRINYYWDQDQISLETDAAGQIIAYNTYGLQRLARILGPGSSAYLPDGDNRAYYLYDGHGDVRGMIDLLGELLGTYDYDPWGNITSQIGEMDNPFRYAGEYMDPTG
ncbi:fibronectin type III domain-containing protein, partial [Paenibacillus lentus]